MAEQRRGMFSRLFGRSDRSERSSSDRTRHALAEAVVAAEGGRAAEAVKAILGWRAKFLTPEMVARAAAGVDAATGRLTPEGEAYLRSLSALWVPEAGARDFAARHGRRWEDLSAEAQQQLTATFDPRNAPTEYMRSVVDRKRLMLVGAAVPEQSFPEVAPGLAAIYAVPPVPTERPLDAQQRKQASLWFRALPWIAQSSMIGERAYERYRADPADPAVVEAIQSAYLRSVVRRHREAWARLSEADRERARFLFGSGYTEDQLAKMAFEDLRRS
jgi:hypothetical protein